MTILWRPSSKKIASTQMVDFAKCVGQHSDDQDFDYDQLWEIKKIRDDDETK